MISFFDCLIFLNSPFSSASLFHIWPSLALLSSSFALIFFAHNSSVFSCLAAFRFSARCLISCSLSIAEFIKVFNWFLFDPASSFVFVFIISWILRQILLTNHHFILVRLKHDVQVVFQIESSFLGRSVNFRKYVRINVQENIFVACKVLVKHSRILFPLIDKVADNFKDTRLTNISTVQINKTLLFADVKLQRNALSPQHIDHFVLCFI